MTEQAIQSKIIKYLESLDYSYVVKVVAATRSGIPDILACVNGSFIAIEVKRPDTKDDASKLQEYNLRKIKQAKGHSLVAWNVDMVKEFIGEMGM